MTPPAQLSSDFAPDSKKNLSSNTEAVGGTSSLLTNPRGKGLRCIKSEDSVLMEDITTGPEPEEDVAVNINDSTDATEYSSSFADSASGNENCSGLSDTEVQSQFFGDGRFASAFDDFGAMFPTRKKKLTSHWRTFIRPLMWRCKWAELKMKEFGSQAIKCDREIFALNQRKHTGSHQYPVEESGSRSLPYTLQEQKQKVLKRRKRERVEDTVDTKSYMSNHNLFSYLGNKRPYQDGTSIADDLCHTEQKTGNNEFGLKNDWSFLEDKDTSLEQIFQKIEVVHSRVQKLKSQLDLIMSINAVKFSSSENLSHLALCDVQTSSVRSPTFSACNGDTMLMGGLYDPIHSVSQYDLGDLMLPDSAVSSFGEAIHIPDIIESTVGILSSVDVTQQYSQMGDSGEDIVDNILMHNQAAEADEAYTSITSKNQQSKGTLKHQEPVTIKVEDITINPVLPPASEPNTFLETAMSQEQSTLKSQLPSDFHFPKNKRKRGERKAGMGNWSRQCPGELATSDRP